MLCEFPTGFDTEITGLDIWHGCKPFFVSTWNPLLEDHKQLYWEWDVDPFTRTPIIPPSDLNAIRRFTQANRLVYHNRKIEQRALESVGVILPRWEDEDTLIASHTVRSSGSHKLKDLSLEHCDILPDDQTALRQAVMECRAIGRSLGWRIAREGDPHFPAMKPKTKKKKGLEETDGWWVMDMWLPRAVAKYKNLPPSHPYWTVCKTYGMGDAQRTALLWLVMYEALHSEGLIDQYLERRAMIETTYEMEHRGVSISREAVDRVKLRHGLVAEKFEARTISLTRGKLTNIRSPKQLREILYYDLKLEQRRSTKKGNLTTDKRQLEEFRDEANPKSRTYHFLDALLKARKHQTCLRYLASYEKFACPVPPGHYLSRLQFPGTSSSLSPGGGLQQGEDQPGRTDTRQGSSPEPRTPSSTTQDTRRDVPRMDERLNGQHHSLNGNSTRDVRRSVLVRNTGLIPKQLSEQQPPDLASSSLGAGRQHHRHNRSGCDRPTDREVIRALEAGRTAFWKSIGRISFDDLPYFLLHPNINITGAEATTRSSSSDPNEQNISKQEEVNLREVFCPLPGREFYSMDYSNIEMRIFAYASGDKRLIEAFETGYKVHLIICEILHPELWAKCQREGTDFSKVYESTWYQWVKNGNFALIYGAQKTKADATYHVPGAYERIRSEFPLIDQFMSSMDATAKRLGYVTTLGGYRLYVPRNRPHVACNYFVQGSAGWYLIKAMNRIHRYLKSVPDYYMTMTVHDELDFDFPQVIPCTSTFSTMPSSDTYSPMSSKNSASSSQASTNGYHADLVIVRDISDIMELSGTELGIPVPASVERHTVSWADGVKLEKLNPNWRTDLSLSQLALHA